MADPSASGTLMGGGMFTEFCTPYTGPIFSKWKNEYGVPIFLHVCGDTGPVIGEYMSVGPDVFSFDYMTDLRYIREAVRNKIVLAGNVNPIDVLWHGNPERVLDSAYRCLRNAGDDRFILTTGCESPRDTPVENMLAMRTAAETYGEY